MGTHSSVLAWRTPGMEDPGGLPSMGSHRVGHYRSDLAAAAAEYIMQNALLDEAQAGLKIAKRNINNLRYADDTTLLAESKELKSFLMKVKEESKKTGFKLNIKKTKIMASSPISSVQLSCSVVSNSLRPHEPQHARPPCPSPTPRVHPNPGPLSQ